MLLNVLDVVMDVGKTVDSLICDHKSCKHNKYIFTAVVLALNRKNNSFYTV